MENPIKNGMIWRENPILGPREGLQSLSFNLITQGI